MSESRQILDENQEYVKKVRNRMAVQLGHTLIELLISLAIALFIISGVVSVMLDSKEAFLLEQELSFIQENARYAIDDMSHAVRMAGYLGCSWRGKLTNTINNPVAPDWKYSSMGIMGYEEDDEKLPSPFRDKVLEGTDVLIVNRGIPSNSVSVASHSATAKTITLTGDSNFKAGEILVVASSDCGNMAIFQKTGPATALSNLIHHGSDGATTPGNCHAALSGSAASNYRGYDCAAAPLPTENGLAYPAGSTIMRFSSNAYYVKHSSTVGLTSLFKETLVVVDGSATIVSRELIRGVEDFEVIYGVDSDETPDRVVDQYFQADDIHGVVGTAVNDYIGWDRVVSARLTFILRSVREVFPENIEVDLGSDDVFNDRFMRQKVSTTVTVRNRMQGA